MAKRLDRITFPANQYPFHKALLRAASKVYDETGSEGAEAKKAVQDIIARIEKKGAQAA